VTLEAFGKTVRPAAPGSSEAVPIWQQVTLPHCFNAEDAVDPDINYYQGAGWYRTQLSIKNPYLNGRVILEFEGAGQKTEVYVYTYKVASHTGGYDGWSVDITEAVQQALANPDCAKRFNGRIPLSVRCDNTRDTEMIPSDLSDFNLYGGLYPLRESDLPARSVFQQYTDKYPCRERYEKRFSKDTRNIP